MRVEGSMYRAFGGGVKSGGGNVRTMAPGSASRSEPMCRRPHLRSEHAGNPIFIFRLTPEFSGQLAFRVGEICTPRKPGAALCEIPYAVMEEGTAFPRAVPQD